MKKLANKPSKLIWQALADLEIIEKNPRYLINMNTYHQTYYDEHQCTVCFAGAVIAQTLKADPNTDLNPDCFPKEENRLYALDKFRQGRISLGFQGMGVTIPQNYFNEHKLIDVNITPYRDSPEKFKEDMHALAQGLEWMGY